MGNSFWPRRLGESEVLLHILMKEIVTIQNFFFFSRIIESICCLFVHIFMVALWVSMHEKENENMISNITDVNFRFRKKREHKHRWKRFSPTNITSNSTDWVLDTFRYVRVKVLCLRWRTNATILPENSTGKIPFSWLIFIHPCVTRTASRISMSPQIVRLQSISRRLFAILVLFSCGFYFWNRSRKSIFDS